MLGKRQSIAEDDKLHPGTRYRHIHSAQIIQETDLSILVGTHETDQDDIAFLPLETVHRVDGDERAEGFEEGVVLDKLAEVLHLCLVGRDEAEVDTLFQHPLLAYLLDVFLQFLDAEVRFLLVDASETFTHKLLVGIHSFSVHPHDGGVVIEDAPVLHLRGGRELPVVEPIR